MNIEIANRLVNLRKSNNLSQEALAEKLGISRQAVSKWERAEASPDTDNLILLARLYQISLDELLKTEEEIPMPEPAEASESVASEGEEKTAALAESMGTVPEEGENSGQENGDYVHVGLGGVHVKGGSGEVHVGWDGVHVDDKEKGDNVHIDKDGVYVNGKKYERNWHFLYSFPIAMVILVVYFLIGCIYGAWHPGWMLFLLIPIWHSLVSAIERGNALCFAWPVMATFIYLCLGIFGRLWHPGWVIFLTIPLYYSLGSWVNSVRRDRKER